MATDSPSGLTRVLAEELRRLCADRRSGTLYFATMNRRLVQVGLDQGEIVSLSYQNEHGADALAALAGSDVEPGVSRFAEGAPRGSRMELPPTAEILSRIESRGAPARRPAAAQGTAALSPEIRNAVAEELTEVIGPIADLLCKEIWGTVTTLDAALGALCRELPDPAQAETFRRNVQRRLR
ncbi:MAG TPA: hypothetical protein VF859_11305 [Burkholderiales bacterium]